MTIRLRDIKLSPDAFAAVMATGILSVAARNHHYTWISNVLSVLAISALLLLVTVTVIAAAARHRLLPWGMSDPEITLPLFTFPAACTVLANRMSSHPVVLVVLGATAGLAWLGLAVITVRNLSGRRLVTLRNQVHGAWLLSSVATSGLAIATAKLATETAHHFWLVVAAVFWGVALALYVAMTSLMVWRTAAERLDRDGFEPDTWILMGSLAIAVVAGHHIQQQVRYGFGGGIHVVTVVAWIVATCWIPPLIYWGLYRVEQRPKIVTFTGAWWTLVFPLGMYSAATHVVSSEIDARPLQTVALVFFWNALSVWLIVVVAGILRIPRRLGRRDVSAAEQSAGARNTRTL